jgi:hypothetical protein
MKIAELSGAEGIERLHTEAKAILGTVLTDGVAALTAVEIEMATKLGTDLGELKFAKAKAAREESALASLSPEHQHWADKLGTDPALVASAKRDAEAELTALSYTTRAELSRRYGGDLVAMKLAAVREGLLG